MCRFGSILSGTHHLSSTTHFIWLCTSCGSAGLLSDIKILRRPNKPNRRIITLFRLSYAMGLGGMPKSLPALIRSVPASHVCKMSISAPLFDGCPRRAQLSSSVPTDVLPFMFIRMQSFWKILFHLWHYFSISLISSHTISCNVNEII